MLRQISSYLHKYLLIWIILTAFLVRLYRINQPLADWHAFRQVDTASVTREYIKHGIDLLHPHYQDLSNIQSGIENIEGYRMVEFPFINAGIASLIRWFPSLPLVPTSRLVSILFSLGTLVSLYFLVRNISTPKTAAWSVFWFAFLPYSIFYSRAVLPESPMLFFSTLSLLSFWQWLHQKKYHHLWFLISATSLSLAALLKPFVLFLGFVYLTIYIVYLWELYQQKHHLSHLLKRETFRIFWFLVFGFVAFYPLYWWRHWIEQYPSGIPANDWLYNSNHIRFRPAWFRWLFYERLTKLITGGGVLLFPFVFLKRHKDLIIYGAWWLGMLIYLSLIATGNVQHDYYQVLLIPIICISLAKGTEGLISLLQQKFSKRTTYLISGVIVVICLSIAWHQVKGYFNINHWEYIEAGQRADAILPADAKVIAPAFGDTIFLFQTNRTGWPIGFYIDDKIKYGAEYYVNTSFDDETNQLMEQYQVVEKTDKYVIIDLTQPKVNSD